MLWTITIALIFGSVFLEEFLGFDISTVLGASGGLFAFLYLTVKGITKEYPKWIAAQNRLIVSLLILGVATVIISMSALFHATNIASELSLQLLFEGVAIYILGIIIYYLSLKLQPSKSNI